MSNCAVVENVTNIVTNKIVAEPTDIAPNNTYLVLIPDGVMCDIGWTWDGQNFIPPSESV